MATVSFFLVYLPIFFLGCISLKLSPHRNLNSRKVSSALEAMGSDQLYRPEDEDGPEFADYLKNLLKLQANRAKTGFSAASSGSSDAYFAKLNRLKIERNTRIRAGLPDDIDRGYKDVDFINAK